MLRAGTHKHITYDINYNTIACKHSCTCILKSSALDSEHVQLLDNFPKEDIKQMVRWSGHVDEFLGSRGKASQKGAYRSQQGLHVSAVEEARQETGFTGIQGQASSASIERQGASF